MTPSPVAFDARLFSSLLATRALGRGVVRALASAPSTNEAAWECAAAAPGASAVVVADFQTAGRGRFGRKWEAPRGAGLLASVVIPSAPLPAARLSAAAAVAAESLERAGVATEIQWPNDVFARASGRKIAGLLLEARDLRPEAPVVVLGIGLNVAQRPEDFSAAGLFATSIRIETGAVPLREALLAEFLAALEPALDALSRGEVLPLEEGYRRRNRLLGRSITILDRGEPVSGIALDLSPECGLALRLPSGAVLRFAAEHVTLVGVGDPVAPA